MEKKLYRLKEDRKISGVCSGLGEYFGIDSSWVRIFWVLFGIFSFGSAILFYIACIFIIPEEPNIMDIDYREK